MPACPRDLAPWSHAGEPRTRALAARRYRRSCTSRPYQVEPTGEYREYPGGGAGAIASKHAMRVVRQVDERDYPYPDHEAGR